MLDSALKYNSVAVLGACRGTQRYQAPVRAHVGLSWMLAHVERRRQVGVEREIVLHASVNM